MREANLHSLNTSPCRGVISNGYIFMAWYLVKHRDNFTFYLANIVCIVIHSSPAMPLKWSMYG